jgi:uncharacterized protein DUF998
MRRAAAGGLIGPGGFIGAWVVGGAVKRGYSPVNDAISRLAAIGASTRPLMTGGFVCFGLAVPAYGLALRDALPGRAWMTAVATGLATLGVAAFPLGVSSTGDVVHGCWATAGYVTLAATPLLAARPLAAAGRRGPAGASVAAGVASGLCLAVTVLGPAHGFWQRAGLTIGDAWLATSAVVMLSRARSGASTPVGSGS